MPEVSEAQAERDPRASFLTARERRIANAVRGITLFGNLSTSAYDWEVDEVRASLAEMRKAIASVEARFQRSRRWPKPAAKHATKRVAA
jgi:hypothetical protein